MQGQLPVQSSCFPTRHLRQITWRPCSEYRGSFVGFGEEVAQGVEDELKLSDFADIGYRIRAIRDCFHSRRRAIKSLTGVSAQICSDGLPFGPDVVFPVEQVRDMRRINYLDDFGSVFGHCTVLTPVFAFTLTAKSVQAQCTVMVVRLSRQSGNFARPRLPEAMSLCTGR